MVDEEGRSKFDPDRDQNPHGQAFVIVGADGLPREAGESGTILRGRDAERYLDGENVSVSGVGIVNINDGIVEGFMANRANSAPDSLAAASGTALRKGDVTEDDFNAAHSREEELARMSPAEREYASRVTAAPAPLKEAAEPENKSRRTTTKKKNDETPPNGE